MTPACKTPIPLPTLVEYWLDELDEAQSATIDEHVISCGTCSDRLAEVVALGLEIGNALRRGFVGGFYTPAFVDWLVRSGMRVRSYAAAPGDTINCTVVPEDDVLIGRLAAPLAGVSRLDVISRRSFDAAEQRFRDVPFDAASGEVIVAAKLSLTRTLPSHQRQIRLVAVEQDGERVIADYLLNHTAYGGRGA